MSLDTFFESILSEDDSTSSVNEPENICAICRSSNIFWDNESGRKTCGDCGYLVPKLFMIIEPSTSLFKKNYRMKVYVSTKKYYSRSKRYRSYLNKTDLSEDLKDKLMNEFEKIYRIMLNVGKTMNKNNLNFRFITRKLLVKIGNTKELWKFPQIKSCKSMYEEWWRRTMDSPS